MLDTPRSGQGSVRIPLPPPPPPHFRFCTSNADILFKTHQLTQTQIKKKSKNKEKEVRRRCLLRRPRPSLEHIPTSDLFVRRRRTGSEHRIPARAGNERPSTTIERYISPPTPTRTLTPSRRRLFKKRPRRHHSRSSTFRHLFCNPTPPGVSFYTKKEKRNITVTFPFRTNEKRVPHNA